MDFPTKTPTHGLKTIINYSNGTQINVDIKAETSHEWNSTLDTIISEFQSMKTR